MKAEFLLVRSVRPSEPRTDAPAKSLARLGEASVHSASIRLRGKTAAGVLRRIRAEWRAGIWPLPDAAVWIGLSTIDPDCEAAIARRRREQELGVAEQGRCRIVLIAYVGAVVDVILSADRRTIGRTQLLLLTEAICRDEPVASLPLPKTMRTRLDLRESDGLAPASPALEDWGLSGMKPFQGRGHLLSSALEWAEAKERLLPAIAIVLKCFRGGGSATVASLVELVPEGVTGPREGLALFTLPDCEGRSVAEFAKSCRENGRFVGWHSAETARALRAARTPIDACLWFDLADPTAALAGGAEYRHRGDLAYPLSIGLERSGEDNGLRLSYSFDRSVYH